MTAGGRTKDAVKLWLKISLMMQWCQVLVTAVMSPFCFCVRSTVQVRRARKTGWRRRVCARTLDSEDFSRI